MERFSFYASVPSHQTDELGNWHSPYFFLAFFDARKSLFEHHGITSERLKNENLAVIVGSLECAYSIPLREKEDLHIKIATTKLGRSSMTFSYEVYNGTRQLCATGKTTQILISTENHRSTSLPEWIRTPLEHYLSS